MIKKLNRKITEINSRWFYLRIWGIFAKKRKEWNHEAHEGHEGREGNRATKVTEDSEILSADPDVKPGQVWRIFDVLPRCQIGAGGTGFAERILTGFIPT